ncbi:MAG: M18 family aminopeptidase [Flavobacteriaceae bacterium]|nr:MAG: M18 family aminopeptidase [Flavobacteriaceae bacterium]
MQTIDDLLSFIDLCPSPFHAVDTLEKRLQKRGFIQLFENKPWAVEKGKSYFVSRGDASIIAFAIPKENLEKARFKMIGAHTDSPCLRVKNNPVSSKFGYQLLNVEIYGGVLLTSWFDKDLKVSGRVLSENPKGELSTQLVTLPYLVKIPRLAIHLDREVNSHGFKPNPQTEMLPILGLDPTLKMEDLLAKEIGNDQKILSFDLCLHDSEKSTLGGVNSEFIFAPRLDNLASVHSSICSLEKLENPKDISVCAYFNHEEIGSVSNTGADSNFLVNTLQKIHFSLGLKPEQFSEKLTDSFLISADMAHGIHPNFPGLHDPYHAPKINQGPVIKNNVNVRYATDGFSTAKMLQWAEKAKVNIQNFSSRNDLGCGSTIGPKVSANLGIPTLDLGNPMLSMHSIREMAGVNDHLEMIKLFDSFFDHN